MESFILFSMVPAQAVWLTAILFLVALVAGWLTDEVFKRQDRFLEREDHELERHAEEVCHCFEPADIARQLKEITFAQGTLPFAILLANSIVQDGHGTLPLLAVSRRAFLWLKPVNIGFGFLAGSIGLYLLVW